MAFFSPAYAKHFYTSIFNMTPHSAFDPNEFIMTPRQGILPFDDRPRWSKSASMRRAPNTENDEYRQFQIECYTSSPGTSSTPPDGSGAFASSGVVAAAAVVAASSADSLIPAPSVSPPPSISVASSETSELGDEEDDGDVRPSVADFVTLILCDLLWWPFVRAGKRPYHALDGMYSAWLDRKMRVRHAVPRAIFSIAAFAFVCTMLLSWLYHEEDEKWTEYVLQHRCQVLSGPFGEGEGLIRR